MKLSSILEHNQELPVLTHGRPTSAQETRNYMNAYFFSGSRKSWISYFRFFEDGSISYKDTNIEFFNQHVIDINGQGSIPIKINSVTEGGLSIKAASLTTLEGLPKTKQPTMTLSLTTPNLKSLEFIPPGLKTFNLVSMDGFSVKNLSTYLKECQKIYLPGSFVGPLLGLFQIEKLEWVWADAELTKVTDIINSHLKQERDIIACKRELISAGLGEYAKL